MTDATTDPTGIEGPRARSTERVVPEWLKQQRLWLLWNRVEKMPFAPWTTGHCYRAAWGADADERPETDYETAKMVAEMPPEMIHNSYPFPTDDDGRPQIPETVAPTIFLPHETHDPPLMLVDFDDVRNPETGAITDEVFEIIKELGSYAEVSRSGTGVHVYVRAALPDGLGKFIAPLDGPGDIELYDHGRFVGATWDHIDGTAEAIAEAQDAIDAYVELYATEDHRKRMGRGEASEASDGASRSVEEILDDIRGGGGSSDGDRSPYYDIPAEAVAEAGIFGRHRSSSPGPDDQGPHPAHGGTSSSDADSTNFFLGGDGTWYCHAHDVSGNGLSLLATCEGVVGCRSADDLWGDPAKMLKTCLYARERGYVGEETDPPYVALVGAAKVADLAMKNPDENVLGEDSWRLARIVYDELEPSEVDL